MNVVYLVLVTSFHGATNKGPSEAETGKLEKPYHITSSQILLTHTRYWKHI